MNIHLCVAEIKEMSENGMSFGSHSYTHPWLSDLTYDQIQNEIKKSTNFCKKIPSDILIISFPYGDFDNRVLDIVKNEGYKIGFTSKVNDAKIIKKML